MVFTIAKQEAMFSTILVSDEANLKIRNLSVRTLPPRNPLITRTFRASPHSVRAETRNLM